MSRKPAVRPVALSVFALFNIVFGWLWWRAVQVEKYPFPDLCSFPNISSLLLSPSELVPDQAADLGKVPDASSATKLGGCSVSNSVLRQRQQWKWRLEQQLKNNTLSCSDHSASTPAEELLQWTTHLRIVPICADAKPAAQWVYRHLTAIGDGGASVTVSDGQCVAVPVASVLAAAGRKTVAGSGSSNGLLTVRISAGMGIPEACTDLPDTSADLRHDGAAPAYAAAVGTAQVEPTAEDPPSLVRLHLLVSSPRGDPDDIRLHIGAGSTMVLVVPQQSDAAEAALASKTAAEAVSQALGRWVLSPVVTRAAAEPDWRLRLWLLGDGSDAAAASDNSPQMAAMEMHASSEHAEKQPAMSISWDVGELLRTSLSGFFEALSTLVDLTFTSQVVLHSGLEELNWAHLVPLALSGFGKAQQGRRMENAALQEAQRRIGNLQEEWDSEQEHNHSSRVVNLGLYKPRATTGAPEGLALAVPFWGFLTVGSPVRANESEAQIRSERAGLGTGEAAAVSAAWIAQLRSLLGLHPNTALVDGTVAATCHTEVDDGICGRECKAQRCLWDVQKAAEASSFPAPDNWHIPAFAGSTRDFSPTQEKAMLVSGVDDALRSVAVYLHPSRRGLADWELGGLAADLHFSMITQAAENIRTLHELLSNHPDLRVAEHVGRAVRHVMQQLHCSIETIQLRPCASLPVAALELLSHKEGEVCVAQSVGGCATSANAAMYNRLALLLARSALKDSKQLLVDGSLEPGPFFSTHFNLAIHLPLLLPFALPTVASVVRAMKARFRKQA